VKDPLFGLVFDPEQTKFEQTPPATLSLCGIARPDAAYQSWIFAAADEADGRYLILGGLSRDLAASDPGKWTQDWRGELARVHGNTCDLIDPPREALMYPTDASHPLTAATVHDLAADAVRRYAQAFGSRKAFVDQLRGQEVFPDQARLAPLRDAINAAEDP